MLHITYAVMSAGALLVLQHDGHLPTKAALGAILTQLKGESTVHITCFALTLASHSTVHNNLSMKITFKRSFRLGHSNPQPFPAH